MKVIRNAVETNWREYTVEVDDAYIQRLNHYLDQSVNGEPHPQVTKNMIACALSYKDDSRFPELSYRISDWQTLPEWIRDFVDEDLWESDGELTDGMVNNYEDSVKMTTEELAAYEAAGDTQLSIFDLDLNISPEGANDHN